MAIVKRLPPIPPEPRYLFDLNQEETRLIYTLLVATRGDLEPVADDIRGALVREVSGHSSGVIGTSALFNFSSGIEVNRR